MKKWQLVLLSFIGIVLLTIMYQQHQTIVKYREIPYHALELLAYPIAKIIELHENPRNLAEAERQQMIADEVVAFSTIFNYAGMGLTTEPNIKDVYYATYSETRVDFAVQLKQYIEATTPEEQEAAFQLLQHEYETYQQFLAQLEEVRLPDPSA